MKIARALALAVAGLGAAASPAESRQIEGVRFLPSLSLITISAGSALGGIKQDAGHVSFLWQKA